uniref:hypothetical protein n=1 Tax=Ningiella ruwaisensis TaxID=2364274 RepID=UPI00109F34E4|nr:hypothetical protein [Ningiella ruwaisensis]
MNIRLIKNSLYIISTLFLFGCASQPQGELFSNKDLQADSKSAKIVIYNNQFFGSANSFLLSDGQRDLAVLSYKSYTEFDTEPGTLELFADLRQSPPYFLNYPFDAINSISAALTAAEASNANNKVEMNRFASLNVEAGKRYFYRLEVDTNGFTTPKPKLIQVEEAEALGELQKTNKALLPSS